MGHTKSAVSSGNVGMQLFQKAVTQELLAKKALVPEGFVASSSQSMPTVLHWSVFNPIEATEPERMHRVLSGAEELCGKWVKSVHTFRQVRDTWKTMGLPIPVPFAPNISDADPIRKERKHKEAP